MIGRHRHAAELAFRPPRYLVRDPRVNTPGRDSPGTPRPDSPSCGPVEADMTCRGLPELSDPVVVAAFEGWNDAGDAATGAVEHLELTRNAEPLAALDPEDYYDFQVNRPTVSLVAGVNRRIEWPTTRFRSPPAGRPRHRADPRHRAEHAVAGVLRRADRARPASSTCTTVVALGALLADVAAHPADPGHRRLRRRGLGRGGSAWSASRYEGPTGILGVFQDAASQAGMPAIRSGPPCRTTCRSRPRPKATLALLHRVEEVLDIAGARWATCPSRPTSGRRRRRDGRAEDDEVAEYVRSLEERARTTVTARGQSGDSIAAEFERYLRRRGRGGRRLSRRRQARGRGDSPGRRASASTGRLRGARRAARRRARPAAGRRPSPPRPALGRPRSTAAIAPGCPGRRPARPDRGDRLLGGGPAVPRSRAPAAEPRLRRRQQVVRSTTGRLR